MRISSFKALLAKVSLLKQKDKVNRSSIALQI